MIGRHDGVVRIVGIVKDLARSDPYPCQPASDAFAARLRPNSSDADDRIISPASNRPHAVMIAEHSKIWIGVTGVRSLIDQCSHALLTVLPATTSTKIARRNLGSPELRL
jgi:hypothetical protein